MELAEHGTATDGTPLLLDRRLFVQLLVFTGCLDTQPLIAALTGANLTGALYEDVSDPRGVGLVTLSEDPAAFIEQVRPVVNRPPFAALAPRLELSMLGRTYSLGHETDLEDVLLRRPLERVQNPAWPWAVWYPIKRSGTFEQLSAEEQRAILMEHGGVGRAFARSGHAHDVRLSCHGLDGNDADFITGLFAEQLHPLSAIVQRMRKTQQTARYLDRLGPFFVGRTRWQSSHAPPTA